MLPVQVYSPSGERQEVTWRNARDMINHLKWRLEPQDWPGEPLHQRSRNEILVECAGLGLALDPHAKLELLIYGVQRLRDGEPVTEVKSTIDQAVARHAIKSAPVVMPL